MCPKESTTRRGNPISGSCEQFASLNIFSFVNLVIMSNSQWTSEMIPVDFLIAM